LFHLEEGTYVDDTGTNLRGIWLFNVPVGDERYVTAALRETGRKIETTTRRYVEELEEQYP